MATFDDKDNDAAEVTDAVGSSTPSLGCKEDNVNRLNCEQRLCGNIYNPIVRLENNHIPLVTVGSHKMVTSR